MGSRMVPFSAAILLFCFFDSSPLPAQQDTPPARRYFSRRVIYIAHSDGALRPAVIEFVGIRTTNIRLLSLGSDGCLLELDLPEEAERDVERMVREHHAKVERLWNAFRTSKPPQTVESLIPKVRHLEQETLEAVDDLLPSLHRVRLDELCMRITMRTVGPRNFCTKAFSDYWEAHPSGLVSFETTCEEIAKSLRKKAASLRRLGIDELLEVLSKEQRDALRSQFGDDYYGKHPNVSLLMWQLRDRPTARPAKRKSAFDYFASPSVFEMSASGELVVDSTNPTDRIRLTVEVLSDPVVVESTGLGQDVADMVAGLRRDIREFGKKQSLELTRLVQQGVTDEPAAGKAIVDRMSAERRAFALRIESRLLDGLTMDQRNRLVQAALTTGLQRAGYLEILSAGTLHDRLRITRDQVARLRKVASRVREKLRTESRLIEQDSLEQVIKALPRPLQVRLRKDIGKPLSELPGALTLLESDLSGWFENSTTRQRAANDR